MGYAPDPRDEQAFKGHVWIGFGLFAICMILVILGGNEVSAPEIPSICYEASC